MKNKRYRLRLATVLTVLFTMIGSTMVFADTLDYSASLKNVKALGIIDSSVTDAASYVTRGQLVKSIVIAEGKSDAAANLIGSTIFPDIDSSSELSGYINKAVNLGTGEGVNQNVITGRADGNFHANDAVTYGEACTMMVRLLGYSDSDLTGAWPNNYIQKAADLDLTKDISLTKKDKLTVGTEAVLFDRLFETLMKKSSSSAADRYFSDNYYNDSTVTGTQKDVVVLGNSKTSDSLSDAQILTDKGTYSLKRGVDIPEIGGKYKMYVDSTTVTKVAAKENTLEGYAVKDISGSTITYTDADKNSKTMILPEATAYYYHGESISYDAAYKSIRAYSSIVVAKDSNGKNDYIVIVDPIFSSKPLIYKNDYKEIGKMLNSTSYDYIYRIRDNSGQEFLPTDDVSFYDDDAVYLVSDLWGRNSFVYVYNKVVYGEITAISPNRFNPSSITISEDGEGSATYKFGEYFDRSRLNVSDSNDLLNIGDTKAFTIGINGEILDVRE